MVNEQDESDWNALDTKLEAYIKRKALDNPIYLPPYLEPVCPNFLNNTEAVFRLLPISGDFPQKKQKLEGWKPPFDESALDNRSDIDESLIQYDVYGRNSSHSPGSTGSNGSTCLASDSFDRIFDSPSSRSTSSSRSSSLIRRCGANETSEGNLREDDEYSSILPERTFQSASHVTTTEVRQILAAEGPTPLSFIDQGSAIVPCLKGENVIDRIPLASINGNCSGYKDLGAVNAQSNNDNMDRSSCTTPVSSRASSPDNTSIPEADGHSTEGDESSQSRTSSHVSDSRANESRTKARYDNKLEAFIKEDALRADPLVADIFYQNVEGTLEYSRPEYTEKVGGEHELSLLDLLELEAFDLVQHSGTVTEHVPSSVGSSYTSGPAEAGTFASASGQSKTIPPPRGSPAGSHPSKNGNLPQDGSKQLVKVATEPTTSQSKRPQLLRCIHNAISPSIFSVNPDYLEKFRACAGPGWSSIQHLKEHMQIHTKKVTKLNPLQCSRCQEEFPDQDELKGHELNVDCPIRCPECPEEFSTKALRQDHQKQSHFEQENDPVLREIDELMWKQIKDNLKNYTDSLKNKKGKASSDPDPEREKWVVANIPRYETGRNKTKVNSKLELGQWYTIFTTLAPKVKILDHPFYDYGTPHSDYAEERILFIHDEMVDARIEAHGPPPSDFDRQREWYREALRDSLRVAAQTRKISHIKRKRPTRQTNRLVTSARSSTTTGSTSGLAYGVPSAMGTQFPQPNSMNSNVPSMSLLPQNYHPSPQQQVVQDPWIMDSSLSDSMTLDPTELDFQFFESLNTMADNNGQSYNTPFSFVGSNDQNTFSSSSTDVMSNNPFSPNSPTHQRGS